MNTSAFLQRPACIARTVHKRGARHITRVARPGRVSVSSARKPATFDVHQLETVSAPVIKVEPLAHVTTPEHAHTQTSLPLHKLHSPAIIGLSTLFAAGGLFGSGFGLEGPGSVIQALGVLAAVVTFHECGHFLAARLQGIHVKAFSVGFGPVLWKYQGKEVEYTLRALPLGGYVAFPEEDGGKEYPADDPDLLRNRSIPERALVISAGVIANLIFAYVILFGQVSTIGLAQARYQPGVLVPEITQFSAADKAGLRRNDLIVAVDGRTVTSAEGAVSKVVSTIKANTGRPVDFTIERSGRYYSIPIVPEPSPEGTGRIGVQLSANVQIERQVAKSTPEALALASKEFSRLCNTVTGGIARAFSNFNTVANQLSGPVAIVAAGSEIARADPVGLYQFAAIVNINLAVVNVLPLPALDGGYLLLLAVEAVRGKKLPEKLEQGISASGLLLLLALGAVLVVRDTMNLLIPM